MWETQVRSLGWEDPLEKEMATHSSILAWRISWMEEPRHKESDTTERLHFHFHLVYVSVKEFGVVGSDMYTWGIKDFHKCWPGSFAKRRLCLGPSSVINHTPLSALSF